MFRFHTIVLFGGVFRNGYMVSGIKNSQTIYVVCELGYGNLPLEAPTRFELVSEGFADLCLTAWPWRHILISMERKTGLEPATSALARRRSTK